MTPSRRDDFDRAMRRIDALVARLEAEPISHATSAARELLASVLDVHGIGLGVIVETIREIGPAGGTAFERLLSDPLVRAILEMHQLAPTAASEGATPLVTLRSSRDGAPLERAPAPEATGARCDLCSAPLDTRHDHLYDAAQTRTSCVCRHCAMLFTSAASGPKRVEPFVRRLDDLVLDDATWASFDIPIGLAYFWRRSSDDEIAVRVSERYRDRVRDRAPRRVVTARSRPSGSPSHGARRSCADREPARRQARSLPGLDRSLPRADRMARKAVRSGGGDGGHVLRSPRRGDAHIRVDGGDGMIDLSAVRAIADAVLYEGYVLYPYRPALKNRRRWTFGGLVPRESALSRGGFSPCELGAECLLETGDTTAIEGVVRFLLPGPPDADAGGFRPAAERSIEIPRVDLASLAAPRAIRFEIDDGTIRGTVELSARSVDSGSSVLGVRVSNESAVPSGTRDDELATMEATHAVLAMRGGAWISSMDPPRSLARRRRRARAARWPVLAGEPGDLDLLLCSPILFEDHPRVAPESPGDLYDATENDELLTLCILSLPDAERAEARAFDPRAAAIIERAEKLERGAMSRLHGAVRSFGGAFRPGDRVVLRPSARADVLESRAGRPPRDRRRGEARRRGAPLRGGRRRGRSRRAPRRRGRRARSSVLLLARGARARRRAASAPEPAANVGDEGGA